MMKFKIQIALTCIVFILLSNNVNGQECIRFKAVLPEASDYSYVPVDVYFFNDTCDFIAKHEELYEYTKKRDLTEFKSDSMNPYLHFMNDKEGCSIREIIFRAAPKIINESYYNELKSFIAHILIIDKNIHQGIPIIVYDNNENVLKEGYILPKKFHSLEKKIQKLNRKYKISDSKIEHLNEYFKSLKECLKI